MTKKTAWIIALAGLLGLGGIAYAWHKKSSAALPPATKGMGWGYEVWSGNRMTGSWATTLEDAITQACLVIANNSTFSGSDVHVDIQDPSGNVTRYQASDLPC